MTTVLIADDNAQITSILAEYLKKEGYEPVITRDGADALDAFRRLKPGLVLLDVMMPRMDGFEVCREIRKASSVPVIMITARGEDFERIMGLDIGADDYIVKPFSPGEVMARVRAVMRRLAGGDGAKKQSLSIGSLTVDLDNYKASVGGQDVALTRKELEILWTLASGRNKVFSRDNLLSAVWGYDYFGDSRTVDSHIKRLRAKLEAFGPQGWSIATLWGVGYRFEVQQDEK